MKSDKIEVVGEHKHIQIREITDEGGYHRRVFTPDMDVSSEVQEIQDVTDAEWTDEVKSVWDRLVTDEMLTVAEFEAAREGKE